MIPLVDFSSCGLLLSDSEVTEQSKQTTGKTICEAFKTVGFVYLVNHGVSTDKVRCIA